MQVIQSIFKGSFSITTMKIICMPDLVPSIRKWADSSRNLCTLDEISDYWKAYNIVTFIANLDSVSSQFSTALDEHERERAMAFKSEYFKNRFIVSRSIARIIFQHISATKSPLDIRFGKEKLGRLVVPDLPGVSMSLSYSDNVLAFTLGKQKVGNDIEFIRPLDMRKIHSIPVFKENIQHEGRGENIELLRQWTLIESYAKLHDMHLYPLLEERFQMENAHYISYLINSHYVLSVASDHPMTKEIVLRIKPENWQKDFP